VDYLLRLVEVLLVVGTLLLLDTLPAVVVDLVR